ncbi:MAG: hypothetical protein U0324_23940 [Polyangiales bacterium]
MRHRTISRRPVLLGFALTLLTPVVAGQNLPAGQVPPACEEAALTREIDAAIDDRVAGRGLQAFDRLLALHGRCPTPRVTAQLGMAEQTLQRWPEAYEHLRAALARPDDPWITSRRAALDNTLREITERLPRLAPQCNVPGAVMLVNGRVVGPLPLPSPHPLTVTSATVELRAPGYSAVRRVVTPAPGTVYTEMFTLEREPAPSDVPPSVTPPTAEAPTASGASGARVLAWITGGVAVAALGVGVAGVVLQRGEEETFRAGYVAGSCDGNPRCYTEMACDQTPSCVERRAALDQATWMAWIGLAAGGALAATSLTLFLASRRSDSPARVTLACGAGPGALGGTCALRF